MVAVLGLRQGKQAAIAAAQCPPHHDVTTVLLHWCVTALA
jgi:hypothetical protein